MALEITVGVFRSLGKVQGLQCPNNLPLWFTLWSFPILIYCLGQVFPPKKPVCQVCMSRKKTACPGIWRFRPGCHVPSGQGTIPKLPRSHCRAKKLQPFQIGSINVHSFPLLIGRYTLAWEHGFPNVIGSTNQLRSKDCFINALNLSELLGWVQGLADPTWLDL